MATKSTLLSDAIELYIGYMRAKKMAHSTIKGNACTLRRALTLWGNIYVYNINPRHVDRLFSESSWNERSTNNNLQRMKAFFAWCRNMEFMSLQNDPCFGWRNVKVPNTEKIRVPVEQFNDLLDAASHPRDRGVVAVGLFLFLRGSEIQTLRVSDLNFQADTVKIYRHKTKEEDVLPMCSELRVEMLRYLNYYREAKGGLNENWLLFPAREKPLFTSQWSPEQFELDRANAGLKDTKMGHTYEPAQRALAALGYEIKGEGGHTLRRSGARALADQLRSEGYDGALLRVASMLGHKNTKDTERYIGWGLERQQRNEMLSGKPMFGDLLSAKRGELRVIGDE